jgi:hypothetical protein
MGAPPGKGAFSSTARDGGATGSAGFEHDAGTVAIASAQAMVMTILILFSIFRNSVVRDSRFAWLIVTGHARCNPHADTP